MNFNDYLKNKVSNIIFSIIFLIILLIFIYGIGSGLKPIIYLTLLYFLINILFLYYNYRKVKKQYDYIMDIIKNANNEYFISALIDYPTYIEALPYYYLLKKANKSAKDEIKAVEIKFNEYKEYIEQWIHEVKMPISSIKLMLENNKNDMSRVLLYQLEEINRYVEQALFYARSEYVEKDYHIKEICLEECVNSVISKNKQVFLINSINLQLYNLENNVYCDTKWLEFIINQILINAIKYRKEEPLIKIYSEVIKNGVQLVIEDNGIGIPENELNRVFDKGFTGANVRLNYNSTGIGLYLCKKLCNKIGLIITIESNQNVYTKVKIIFPKGTLCKF